MGRGRTLSKISMTRPIKGEKERRRRQKVQRRRLAGLGVPEAQIAKMNPKAVRVMLKRPVKVAKQYSTKKAAKK